MLLWRTLSLLLLLFASHAWAATTYRIQQANGAYVQVIINREAGTDMIYYYDQQGMPKRLFHGNITGVFTPRDFLQAPEAPLPPGRENVTIARKNFTEKMIIINTEEGSIAIVDGVHYNLPVQYNGKDLVKLRKSVVVDEPIHYLEFFHPVDNKSGYAILLRDTDRKAVLYDNHILSPFPEDDVKHLSRKLVQFANSQRVLNIDTMDVTGPTHSPLAARVVNGIPVYRMNTPDGGHLELKMNAKAGEDTIISYDHSGKPTKLYEGAFEGIFGPKDNKSPIGSVPQKRGLVKIKNMLTDENALVIAVEPRLKDTKALDTHSLESVVVIDGKAYEVPIKYNGEIDVRITRNFLPNQPGIHLLEFPLPQVGEKNGFTFVLRESDAKVAWLETRVFSHSTGPRVAGDLLQFPDSKRALNLDTFEVTGKYFVHDRANKANTQEVWKKIVYARAFLKDLAPRLNSSAEMCEAAYARIISKGFKPRKEE
jgi:hypothetical protein